MYLATLVHDEAHVIIHLCYIPTFETLFSYNPSLPQAARTLALLNKVSIRLPSSYLQFGNLSAMGDTTEPNVLSLLVQIDSLGKSLSPGSKQDAETRRKLRLAARDLSRALEEPSDTVERVCFSVRNSFRLKLF